MKPLAMLFAACLATAASADVVHLTDGSTLEGDIKRTSEGWVVTDSAGKVTPVAAERVTSIELKKGPATTDTSEQRLASLRRSVANLSDIKQVLERYKNFINQNAETPAAKEAQDDIARWQERLDKGLVKAGDQWVTKEHQAELESRAMAVAIELCDSIRAGKLNEAGAAVDKALATSPQSAPLLYLKALILYRQEQLAPARKLLESILTSSPDQAPTHNNLAVILWRQRTPVAALNEYDKAMLAAPENPFILDNVAEALNALTPEHRKAAVTRKVVEHFKEQDGALQKKMATRGLYRWGSTWVSEAEFTKLQAAEKASQDKLDALNKQADEIQERLIRIDRDMTEENNLMNAMQQQTLQMDPQTGRVLQFPLPQRYYDLRRDYDAMRTEKTIKQRDLQRLQKQIAEQKLKGPAGRYTGIQRIVDVEGLPGGPPPAPPVDPAPSATQPAATRPARP